jgi:hypothetical protein
VQRGIVAGQFVLLGCTTIVTVGACTYPIVNTCLNVGKLQVQATKLETNVDKIMVKLEIK